MMHHLYIHKKLLEPRQNYRQNQADNRKIPDHSRTTARDSVVSKKYFYRSIRKRSASRAALHPLPAAVMACR